MTTQHEALTTVGERQLHDRLVSLSDYGHLYPLWEGGLSGYILCWLRPFRRERVRDYAWRLLTRRALPRAERGPTSAHLRERLPAVALSTGRIEST